MDNSLPPSPGNPFIPIQPGPSGGSASTNKEVVNASMNAVESPTFKEMGQEEDALPKEVTSAGVTIHPTSIPVPTQIAHMGVKPVGANIPMPTAATALPITDDKIALGLAKSIKESFRWLAEWCIRRLKQAHVGLQSIHGKLVRVQTR